MIKDNTIYPEDDTLYWIAHSPDRHAIVHYGVLEPGLQTTTGQDELEEYSNKDAWLTALDKLGITPEEEEIE